MLCGDADVPFTYEQKAYLWQKRWVYRKLQLELVRLWVPERCTAHEGLLTLDASKGLAGCGRILIWSQLAPRCP